MHPLQSLAQDHQLLWGLTEALDAYAAALEADEPLLAGDLTDLVHGFRTVADYRHFDKEEQVLVPVLVRNGFDYNREILQAARQEHDKLRYLIEVLHQSAQRELDWNRDERRRITSASRSLAARQRRLASQQEAELFPEIITRLDAPVLGQLTAQLWAFDERSDSRGHVLNVDGLSRQVVARYASTLPFVPEPRR